MIMPKHSRKRGTLLLSKFQDMGGDIATYIAIECHDVCDEDAIEDLRTTAAGLREALRALQLVRAADAPAQLPLWFPAQNIL